MQRAVRRRTIVAAVLLGFGLTVTPASVDAQQHEPTQRIGIIAGSSSPATWRQAGTYQNFFKGLRELGYEEGRNVAIEFRSAEGHPERFPAIAADLVGPTVEI